MIKTMEDALIIGAGPVGSFTAYLLAKQGYGTEIYEEHAKVGKPVQCTGILTAHIKELIRIKSGEDFINNRIKRIIVNIEGREGFEQVAEIKLKDEELIVDRERFDSYIAGMAQDRGAELHAKHRFKEMNQAGEATIRDIRNSRDITVRSRILIGSDGPNSRVARSTGLKGAEKYYIGSQVRARHEHPEDAYSVYLGRTFNDFFGWVVPEDGRTARIGVASMSRSYEKLNTLLRIAGVKKDRIIGRQGGLIPLFNTKARTEGRKGDMRTFIVGDAASQVKASTGGGIIPGMKAAMSLAKAVKEGESYEKEWRADIGRSLTAHLIIRRVMNRFKSRDYQRLADILQDERVKRIISASSREFPLKMMFSLLLAKPSLARFITKLRLSDLGEGMRGINILL